MSIEFQQLYAAIANALCISNRCVMRTMSIEFQLMHYCISDQCV